MSAADDFLAREDRRLERRITWRNYRGSVSRQYLLLGKWALTAVSHSPPNPFRRCVQGQLDHCMLLTSSAPQTLSRLHANCKCRVPRGKIMFCSRARSASVQVCAVQAQNWSIAAGPPLTPLIYIHFNSLTETVRT